MRVLFYILFFIALFECTITFSQTINYFSPAYATHGTQVTIIGSGFNGGSISVTFNGQNATTISRLNDNTIVATVPSGTTIGSGDVTVKKGSNSPVSKSGFTCYSPTGYTGGPVTWPFVNLLKPTCSPDTDRMPSSGISSCTKWPVTNNEDWDNPNTWNGGAVPANMDIVCIPAGIKVNVYKDTYTEVTSCSTANPIFSPRLFIFVCGQIDFTTSGASQLYLGCQSSIQVWPGGKILAKNGNSELIKIGEKIVWRENNKDLPGPYYLGDGCGPLGCVGEGVLPVILSSFQGKLVEANSVSLTWATTHEYNSSSFEIERSENGISWFKIGSVKSSGGERTVTNYSYSDRQPRPGKNLYRLKQIDQDGKHTYSEVVTIDVNAQKSSSYAVFPNPAKDKVTIFAKGGFAQGMQAQLYHKNGMLLETKYIQSTNAQTIDISDLSNGLYFMRIVDAKGATVHTQSVIKN